MEPLYRRGSSTALKRIFICILLLVSFQATFSQNITPASAPSSETKESNSQGKDEVEDKSPSQKEIRGKRKFFFGGGFFKGYGSGIVGWNVWEKVAIGLQYYQNSYVINGDFDSRYAYFVQYAAARQSDREWKNAGGGVFLNYFLADSSLYIPIHVGAEYFRQTVYDQFVDLRGPSSYRSERIHLDYGPRYYVGTGIGFRHQLESGFFFGFEVVVRTFGRYHKNVTVQSLEYADHSATVSDYWIRKEEIKRDHGGKVSDAGFDFAVGLSL
ncbi:hypothetical protein EHQ12_11910 [Leptospira gomenensis]|uniref:Outer membrane protein beta-barrel domain-containing protein n=1 Tax=Leptospira gomenensis TaxID=2484974 RepID=A0A5F1YY56_9LEPT|nr:hypothetical protein [Leptospira gomenensis]TGK32643.1 hypothetical protein EHQ17_11755 [Leptospira gomenensis]TGK36791.1 hypothetical protein EHQ12_11910 [Leptospira gomenensis]TGK48803.1 hypothetical protein EHQ07_05525 [Leptospira gomenensis]TGK64569.1 hypothetical protein EHQ13_06700 [Leptospira gomenensis]